MKEILFEVKLKDIETGNQLDIPVYKIEVDNNKVLGTAISKKCLVPYLKDDIKVHCVRRGDKQHIKHLNIKTLGDLRKIEKDVPSYHFLKNI